MIQIFTLETSKSVHNGEFQPPNTEVSSLGVIHKRRPQQWGMGVKQKRTWGGGGSSKSVRPYLIQTFSI